MPSKQRDRGPPTGAVRRHGKPAGLPAGFRWRETGLWPALRVHRQRPCGAPSGSTPFPPLRASPGKSLRAFPHRPLPKANQQQHLLGNSTSGTAALRWPLLLHHLTGLRPSTLPLSLSTNTCHPWFSPTMWTSTSHLPKLALWARGARSRPRRGFRIPLSHGPLRG